MGGGYGGGGGRADRCGKQVGRRLAEQFTSTVKTPVLGQHNEGGPLSSVSGQHK